MSDLVHCLRRGSFQKCCDLSQFLFHFFIVIEHTVTGQCLDTAHTGCDTRLRNDLKGCDHTCIGYMGTAAQFLGEISHGNHAHTISVLFPKKSHGPCFLGVFNAHNLCHNGKCCLDLLIDHCLHLSQFLLGHSLEMGKVKAQPVRCHKRTLLLYMGTQNRFQGFLQKMGGTVVLTGIRTVFCADL